MSKRLRKPPKERKGWYRGPANGTGRPAWRYRTFGVCKRCRNQHTRMKPGGQWMPLCKRCERDGR